MRFEIVRIDSAASAATVCFCVNLDAAATAACERAFEGLAIRRVAGAGPAEFFAHEQLTSVGCAVVPLPDSRDDIDALFAGLTERCSPLSVIFLAERPDVRNIVAAIRCGASDVLSWPDSGAIAGAVVAAALERSREAQFRLATRAAARTALGKLNHGERDVLEQMLAGRVNKSVASRLGIALRTVENRRKQVFTKLGTRSLAEIVRLVQAAESPGRAESSPFPHLGRDDAGDSHDLIVD